MLSRVAATLLVALSAQAGASPPDEERARQLSDQGMTHFNQGRYRRAVESFQASFAIHPLPLLLFDIAQAHRLENDCPLALQFYRLYRQAAPDASNRMLVDGFIADMERCPRSPALPPPLYRKWWLWTSVAAATVALGLGVGLGVGLSNRTREPSLGAIPVASLSWLGLIALAGCTPPCRASTVFLDLKLPGALASSIEVDVVLSLDGAPEEHNPITRLHAREDDSLEIDVPGYAPNRRLSIRVDALDNGVRRGSGSTSLQLGPTCTQASVALAPVACPTVTAAGVTFVDPNNGSDDAAYGGGEGICANRTLTFALAHAPGLIRLAPALYQLPDETLPFVLTGAQSLDCGDATLVGNGAYAPGNITVTVVFAGSSNQIDHCKIVGGPLSIACVFLVETAGEGDGHRVDHSDISQCPPTSQKGAAITVDIGGDRLTVSNSTLSDAFFGVDWALDGHTGSMINNTFENIRDSDIICTDAVDAFNPGVTGMGNHHSMTAAYACATCVNCPF